MPQRELEARVRHHNGTAIIDLRGELDAEAEDALDRAYGEATASGAEHGSSHVLLNFEQVSYMNSKGIALLIGLLMRARGEDRQVLACGLSDHYREIFTITRLVDYMAPFPDEASALAAVT